VSDQQTDIPAADSVDVSANGRRRLRRRAAFARGEDVPTGYERTVSPVALPRPVEPPQQPRGIWGYPR
jgi:hypothetical protein